MFCMPSTPSGGIATWAVRAVPGAGEVNKHGRQDRRQGEQHVQWLSALQAELMDESAAARLQGRSRPV